MKLPAPIHDLYHNEEPTKATGYLTDEITARGEAFIQQHNTAPFFLEVAYNATHWPFQAPDLPEAKRAWTNSIESGTRAGYIAMLERADQGIGRILGLLDRLKLSRNTLVIFTSDNGGEWLSRNAPLFHRKSTLWEGGIRVPLLMRWPSRLKPGITSSQVGITMDLTASILAAAGITPPASYRRKGLISLALCRKARSPIARCSGDCRRRRMPRGPRRSAQYGEATGSILRTVGRTSSTTSVPIRESSTMWRNRTSHSGRSFAGWPTSGKRTSMPRPGSARRRRHPPPIKVPHSPLLSDTSRQERLAAGSP
jgi:hypothetical protein